MIFQEIKEALEKRQYTKIDGAVYREFLDEASIDLMAFNHGPRYKSVFPPDYYDLREWIYNRVAKDIVYQNTGYLNDHFCIGVLYGMLRMCDDQAGDSGKWYEIYEDVLGE